MKKCCSILTLICFIFLFTSCNRESLPIGFGSDEDDTPAVYVELTNVYTETPLVPQGSPEPGGSSASVLNYAKPCILNDTILLQVQYTGTDTYSHAAYAQFDMDGSFLGYTDLPELLEENLWSVSAECFLPDGSVWFLERTETNVRTLYHLSADNEILAEYTFASSEQSGIYICCADDRVFLSMGTTLYVLSDAAELIRQIPLTSTLFSLDQGSDGFLYARDAVSCILRIDPESGKYQNLMTADADAFEGMRTEIFGLDGTLYVQDEIGIYAIGPSEDGVYDPETASLVLDWNNSALTCTKTEIRKILGMDMMIAFSSNNLNSQNTPVLLKPMDPDTSLRREEVLLLLPDSGTDADSITEAAAAFNRQSDKYLVRIRRTDGIRTDDERTAFMNSLSAEGYPDILAFSYGGCGEELYRMLTSKNYLADLSALTAPMTGSAAAAVSEGELCRRIPLFIRYDTIVSSAVDGELTLDSLTGLAGSLAGEQYLFADASLLEKLYRYIQAEYTDPAAQTCRFDSDEFRRLLELMRTMDSWNNTEEGTIEHTSGAGYGQLSCGYRAPQNTRIFEMLNAGDLLFLSVPFGGAAQLGALQLYYDGEDFTFCGYPGTMAIPDVQLYFTVFRDAGCTEGAEEFLQYMLSEEVQTSYLVNSRGFPVTSAGAEWLLQDFYYIYSHTNDALSGSSLHTTDQTLIPWSEEMLRINNRTQLQYTADQKAFLRDFLEDDSVSRITDPTIHSILQEEIGAYLSGDRTADDTVDVLQSRIGIYLAE